MFIIWGTKSRQERLGTVADWCPNCRRMQAFSVTSYFRVGHIYFISLGRGSLAATVRECWECESQYHCDEEDYDEFLPVETAEQMSISELLHQTNRDLEDHLEAQRRAQPASRNWSNAGKKSTEILDALPADDETTLR